ncbi:MAG: radical SAM protein, partial [Geminicoccaceae bacterium]
MPAGATTATGRVARERAERATAPVAIDLLVIQPTPFCNIDCRYCYLPARDDRSMLSMSTLRNLFRNVFASGWAGPALDVVWHAGEPMTLPVAFYRAAFRAIDELTPVGLTVMHAMQTNATLISEEWCDFLLAEDVAVGVSIDGPQRFHDAQRVTRSGRGTFDRTISGLRTLRRHGVPFHVITVLTEDSMRCPDEMFDFMTAEGIRDIGFNVEESEGSHVSPVLAAVGIEELYETFMREFWRLAAGSPGPPIAIREINTALEMLLTPRNA